MKAFVHLGMHKTGTSSVQESYARQAPAGFFYPTGRGANLNVDARLLFEEDTICAQIPDVLRHGQEVLPQLRRTAEESLLRQLSESPCDKVILSAERFTYMIIRRSKDSAISWTAISMKPPSSPISAIPSPS